MASTSASELAREVLDDCLADGTWPARTLDALIERALDDDELIAMVASRALFSILIERLGDLFEPALCEIYAQLFTHVIARAMPGYDARDLLVRYRNVRQVRRFAGGEVKRVFVLSRVTLGADVAVTSVVLAAAKERFPDAEICFVGPAKNAELFAADTRIVPVVVPYARTSLLKDRLAAAEELQTLIDHSGTVVIDPDSRLTQLGLIPVCDDARYFFFESRAFGGDSEATLPELTAAWLNEVFGTGHAGPYVAPDPVPASSEVPATITLSLGVGENEDKRLGDEFEFRLTSALIGLGYPVLLDRGAGGEESLRADRVAGRLQRPELLHFHEGSYASFAGRILNSRLYVGYDSAGQHVAAAGGVPLISVFSGYACDRMLARWRPAGPGAQVIVVNQENRATALSRTLQAIEAAAERLD